MLETPKDQTTTQVKEFDMNNGQSAGNDYSWLAAMVNGEGSIGLNMIWGTPPKRQRRRYFSPRVAVVSNTDPAIVVRCIEIVESLGIHSHYIQEKNDGTHKVLFTLRIDRMEDIRVLLSTIVPFMVGEKKARGQLVLRYVESRLKRINTSNPKWENVRPSQRHKKTNPPYNDEELEIAEAMRDWNPNDYTLPAAAIRRIRELQRRYSLNSDRKTESVAEMTTPLHQKGFLESYII